MTMKIKAILLIFLLSFFGIVATICPKVIGATSWHDLSQTKRNERILDRAYEDEDKFGGWCKEWVQDIVFDASNGAVYPPPNHKKKDRWKHDPKKYPGSKYCIGRCGPITSARPGEIVQIRWKTSYVPLPNNLHTFIVVSVNSSSITVIDSNGKNKKIVRERELPIHYFDGSEDAKAESFHIYYIL